MRVFLAFFAWIICGGIAVADGEQAGGEQAGDFDYYVLSLSWSPNWCALVGDDRNDPQCNDGLGLTFTLHGLWPQYEQGYPSDCRSVQRDPSQTETAAMADIMGGSGLAWHEWKKHGRCAGVSSHDYFTTMRRAYGSVTIPPVFAQISKDLLVPASVVEDAFLESNPAFAADQITVTCDQAMIQDVRICLTKDLSPRRYGADVIRDCRMPDAGLDAVR